MKKCIPQTGLILFTILLIMTTGCKSARSDIPVSGIDSIIKLRAPDKREAIFNAQLFQSLNGLILRGETDDTAGKATLVSFLGAKGISFTDSLNVLPDSTVGGRSWGLVNVSVSNLRAGRSYSSELVSQALMGTPLKILKKEGGWYLVRTPDRYLGMVDTDVIVPLNDEEFLAWKGSERVFFTGKTGDIFAGPDSKEVVSDIVAGSILQLSGVEGNKAGIILPDGRRGFIPASACVPLEDVNQVNLLTPVNLRSTALSYMGIPYLWGGTSVKGFDCSGFVKCVYFQAGIILARDASLQFRHGISLGISAYPDSLETGDLLFFGSVRDGKPRATHVGMYIGNSEFIHASGMVRVNSLDPAKANYSEYRKNSFLGVRRIIGAGQGDGIRSMLGHDWYF